MPRLDHLTTDASHPRGGDVIPRHPPEYNEDLRHPPEYNADLSSSPRVQRGSGDPIRKASFFAEDHPTEFKNITIWYSFFSLLNRYLYNKNSEIKK